jgi:hypothetical protein
MMKRFGILNEIMTFSKNKHFNLPQFIKIHTATKFNYTTLNSGVKTIDLIKILRAETSN